MNEEKQCPSYNINVGVPTEIESFIKIKTYKYHPYGLEGFRQDLIRHIEEWQSKGLAWVGHDQLTHAWRTPWDTHVRYNELMSPIVATVLNVVKNHSPDSEWYLKDCWISEYTQNSGANKHNHGDDTLGWSFCYYVKIPDSGPAFTLCDDVNSAIHQLNVAEGDLLIFRHPLHHQVFPSIDRRIIISGNVHVDEFDSMLSLMVYNNDNFAKESTVLNAKPDIEIDVDNWNNNVFEQKFKTDFEGGY